MINICRTYTRGDIPRAILKEKFVFILEVAVLPDLKEDSYLETRKRFMNDANYLESIWYNDEEIVGTIR